MLAHAVLAVNDQGVPLGRLHQDVWARSAEEPATDLTPEEKEAKKKVTRKEEARRALEEKERDRWLTSVHTVEKAVPAGQRVLVVGDREADISDLFPLARRSETDLLVRSSEDRRVSAPERTLWATLAELRRRYEETTAAETRTRYQMLLLSLRGQTSSQIAQNVLRSQDTVVRVLKRFFTGGLDAVLRRTAPGRERRVTAAWEAELLRVISWIPMQSGRTLRTGRPNDSPSIWASTRTSRSRKRRSVCTYMPMATSVNVPPGRCEA